MKKYILSLFLAICFMFIWTPEVYAAGDSMSDATGISLGGTYQGTISETNSIDYYEFTLPSSGKLELRTSANMECITYEIYDNSGNKLWNSSPKWNSTTKKITTDDEWDLIKGTYYLAVRKNSGFGNYSFIFDFVSANESFTETDMDNNNSTDLADEISLEKQYFGQLAKNDEKDFYKLTLPSSGSITLNASAYMKWTDYTIYDSEGNKLWMIEPSWNSVTGIIETSEIIDLTKGTYYLKVSKRYGMYLGSYTNETYTGNYSFTANFKSANESFVETSTGNNNNIYMANEISLNNDYQGQIAIDDSKDFYRFMLPSSGKVKFEAVAKIYEVRYRVYDSNGNELWTKKVYWNDTTKESIVDEKLDLTTGTYYLVVEKYDGNTGNYSFSLSTGLKFTDIPSGAFYEEPVDWAVSNDITAGTGNNKFSPNDTCTRGQIVTFLWRAAGRPEPRNTKNVFHDVKEGQYYYTAVLWAVENGITSGTGNGRFEPEAPCTRAQVVTFLWRQNGEPRTSGGAKFTDVPTGAYYSNAVAWAVKNDITKGTGNGRFSPNDMCTRGQIVTFLYRDLGL